MTDMPIGAVLTFNREVLFSAENQLDEGENHSAAN